MKYKQKVDFTIAIFLTFIAVLALFLPAAGFTNVRYVDTVIFIVYTTLNLIRFILLRETKDFEGLHYAVISFIFLIASIFIDDSKPIHLAFVIFGWTSLMSLAKLKKADYYHDRRDRMWRFAIADLVIFLVTGIIASINLTYSSSVQILVIGFFMLINGILEIMDPLIKHLIARN